MAERDGSVPQIPVPARRWLPARFPPCRAAALLLLLCLGGGLTIPRLRSPGGDSQMQGRIRAAAARSNGLTPVADSFLTGAGQEIRSFLEQSAGHGRG